VKAGGRFVSIGGKATKRANGSMWKLIQGRHSVGAGFIAAKKLIRTVVMSSMVSPFCVPVQIVFARPS
jgi:hypothetical protein